MNKEKIKIGEMHVSPHTIPQAVEEINVLLANPGTQPRTLHFLNAHVYVLASKNPELKKLLEAARLLVADGMAIVWCSTLTERCNMTELFRAYLESTKETRTCVLLGGNGDELRLATGKLNEGGKIRVMAGLDGYQNPATYQALMEQNRTVDFVLLGMGTPKSEQIAALAALACPNAIIWHIGGGTIQFLAGTIIEAPVWMRRAGLQWLFRLCMEPKRMWRRYIIGLPLFFWKILKTPS
jgi:N-acetylglucosaminyldiphosphoundecaprenol N-acetyl-beta-D-mannosaminyltransferase